MSSIQVFQRASLAAASCAFLAVALGVSGTDHAPYKDAKHDECRECHTASGVMDNHGPFFDRQHRLLAQKPAAHCAECHPTSYCLDCHAGGNVDGAQRSLSRRGEPMPPSHGADFISTHALKAADDPRGCYRCHETKFCSDCHNNQIVQNRGGGRAAMSIKPHKPVFAAPGVPDPSWVTFHRSEARRNLQSCQGCHPQKIDCSNFACHPGLGGR